MCRIAEHTSTQCGHTVSWVFPYDECYPSYLNHSDAIEISREDFANSPEFVICSNTEYIKISSDIFCPKCIREYKPRKLPFCSQTNRGKEIHTRGIDLGTHLKECHQPGKFLNEEDTKFLEIALGVVECGVVYLWEKFGNENDLDHDRRMITEWTFILIADKIHWRMWEMDQRDRMIRMGEENDAAERVTKNIVEGKRQLTQTPVWIKYLKGEMEFEELRGIERGAEQERLAREEEEARLRLEEQLRRAAGYENGVEMTDVEDLDDLEEGEIRE